MNADLKPPVLGRWLIALRRLGDRRAEVESDFLELYRERAAARGLGHARRRYILDALSVWTHRRPRPNRIAVKACLAEAEGRRRAAHRTRPFEGIVRDVVFGARVYKRQWGLVAMSVVSLGLAIGLCTTAFSGVYALFLKPLGVGSPSGAVHVWRNHKNGASAHWSFAEFVATRDHVRSVTLEPIVEAHVATGDDNTPTDVNFARMALVTGTFFGTFGGEARLGRLLGPGDDVAGAPLVAVVNYYFWNRWLGGDPGIVGRTIRLGKIPVLVVGVASRWFTGPAWEERDFWLPMVPASTAWPRYGPLHASSTTQVRVVGQLAKGRTIEQVRAETSAVLRSAAAAGAATTLKPATGVDVARPAAPDGGVVPGVALGAIALVLVLASLNVANLLLASGAGRRREMAVRLAMGATRGRLTRQLLTESLVLAGGAALVALLFSTWFTVPLARLVGLDAESSAQAAPSLGVYLFLGIASLVAGFVAGFAPARTGAKGDLLSPIRGDGTPGIGAPPSRRLRAAFIGLQAAASMVLLVLAALLARALVHSSTMELGFPVERLLNVSLSIAGKPDASQVAAIYAGALERFRALPGVEAVALVTAPPLEARAHATDSLNLGGRPYLVTRNFASAEYFDAAGLRFVRGRSFTAEEIQAGSGIGLKTQPPVAIVSERLARDYWGEADPIGSSLDRVDPTASGVRVVGIIADAVTYRIEEPTTSAIYYPLSPLSSYYNAVVRVASPVEAFADPIRSAARSVDSRVSVSVFPATRFIARAQRQAAMFATLGGLGGALALALAVMGVFSVTAFVVGQRTREIGLRMAVGASAPRIVRLLLREGLRPVVIGLAVGLLGAIAGSRVLESAMFGLSPTDPLALAAATAVLLAAGSAAILIPARRAARVDPAKVLRES